MTEGAAPRQEAACLAIRQDSSESVRGRGMSIECLLLAGDDLPGLLGCIGVVKETLVFRTDETIIFHQLPIDRAALIIPPD